MSSKSRKGKRKKDKPPGKKERSASLKGFVKAIFSGVKFEWELTRSASELVNEIIHLRDFKKNLITGLVTLVPLLVTLYIFYLIIESIGGSLAGLLLVIPFVNRLPRFILTLISLGLAVLIAYIVGAMTSHWAGQEFIQQVENIFLKIPLVKTIYLPAKELTQTIFTRKKLSLGKVVLVEFPTKGSYAIAFITSDFGGALGEKYYNVFVPTTPNPTSGWYLIMPAQKVKLLNIKPESALKIVVSGGIVFSEQEVQDIIDHLESEELKKRQRRGSSDE